MALRLLIENEKQLPDGGPTSYTLNVKGAVEIGRAQYLDWVLPDTNKVISNKHCEIRWNEGAYWLTDCSRNGTYLNGSEDRMAGTERLKNGDRIAIGHYIVAVSIDEAAEVPQPRSGGLPRAVQLNELWASSEEAAPPIDPKLLRPRSKEPRDDFLGRVADLPWVDTPPSAPLTPPMPPSRMPAPPAYAAPSPNPPPAARGLGSDDDWLPRREQAAPPPSVWDEPPVEAYQPPAPPPFQPPAPPPQPANPPEVAVFRPDDRVPPPQSRAPAPDPWMAPPPPTPPAPPPRMPSSEAPPARPAAPGVDADAFMARFAKGLGMPERAFAGRDPGEFAETLGRLVQMVTAHLKALLDDRQQAKRAFRVSNHTMIAAFENNPLKFQPTVQHALAVMFGPPNENYQDATTALDEAFKDLAEHQLLTFSAMQKAVQLLEKEIAPEAIEASMQGEKGLAAMVGWSHGRLWDAYVHRWADRTKYQGDGLSGAFMRDFAKCYDDLQKANK